VIRAVGHDAESPFMASLFALSATPAPLNATIFREYSLLPDVDAMQFNLSIRNDGNATLNINAPYVGMAMNRGLRHWINGSGFDFGSTYDSTVHLNTSAEFYAAVGDRISYSVLLLNSPDSFSPIINFAHVLIAQYPQLQIPPGQTATLRFLAAVGTGDTGTLQTAHKEILGNLSDLLPLSGTVTDAAGVPVAAARVHVTDTAGTQAVAFARTAADGTWTAPVRIGSYGIRAIADDRPGSAPQTINVPGAGLTGVALKVGAQSTIVVKATDTSGFPLPAKIVLEPGLANPRPALPAALGEMWDRQPIVIFSADGTATVPVFPGSWRVTLSRGFEYSLYAADVNAVAGGSVNVTAPLARVVDTTGWVSGDFHIHAQHSPDGDDLFSLKVRAFAGEGVEVPVSTEHEFVGDFGPAAQALSLTPFMHTIAGTELTTTATGHFNVFPLTPMAGVVNAGGFSWYNKTIPAVMAEARARLTADGDPPILQMNHPRTSGMAYLDAVHFDPASFSAQVDAADYMTSWDAMEVWNGTPLPSFQGCIASPGCVSPKYPTAYDWFSFLDRAKYQAGTWTNRITGTGNSDSHNAELREVGYPRNYLKTGVDDPAQITDKLVTTALRAAKVSISGGPFLTIEAPTGGAAGGAISGIGGLVQPDHSVSPVVVHLTVKVQAPKWMGALQRVDIWVGDSTSVPGATVVQSIDLSAAPVVDGLRSSTTVDIPVTVDTWILATVTGPTDSQGNSHALWPVVQAPVPPYAITNPIWVDYDTDGMIKPLR